MEDLFATITIGYIFGVLFSIIVYLAPSIIAFDRRHHYKWVILAINIGLGFTLVGWLFPLLWAVWPIQTQVVDVLNKDIVTNRPFSEENSSNNVDHIEKLHSLRTRNIITEEEFQEKKKKLMEKI